MGMTQADRVAELVGRLTLQEQAALTVGDGPWATVAVPRVGLPGWRMTDGPNGARGLYRGPAAPGVLCIPCGTALGATWDPDLVRDVAGVVARETRRLDCRMLLAPTVNIIRSPLAGRTFECYSEDPVLTAAIAVGFIEGVQAEGVVATVKHFAGNEAEFERYTIESVVPERALREIYLPPFEAAVRDAGVLAVMTAYNRINGAMAGAHRGLIGEVLRGEWGFDGLVVSDWWARAETVGSALAGQDLEMPGPGRAFGPALVAAVEQGLLPAEVVAAQATHLIGAFAAVGALDDPDELPAWPADVPDRDHLAEPARRAAAESIVLLRNTGVLPVTGPPARVAVVGPNAAHLQLMGGGSAHLRPTRYPSLLEALRATWPGVEIVHEPGCRPERDLPVLQGPELRTGTGEPGWTVEFLAGDATGPIVHTCIGDVTDLDFFGDPAPGFGPGAYTVRATGFMSAVPGEAYDLCLTADRPVRLLLDGTVVATTPGRYSVTAGSDEIELRLEFDGPADRGPCRARLGVAPADDGFDRAVAAAEAADLVIAVVGTNEEEEQESLDRSALALPGRQDELVSAVAGTGTPTVVVVNAGSAVTLPWADEVDAVLYSWFGGEEADHALVDVLTGATDPGGRLPMTLPLRVEHTPAFGNFPGEFDEVRYGEGVLVGYRWYDTRALPVRYPFGHGLSYTSFEIGAPVLRERTVDIPVHNVGHRAGSEVVQLYVEHLAPRVFRPRKELRAFEKVRLGPGGQHLVRFELDDRAFAYWRPARPTRATAAADLAADSPFRLADDPGEPGWCVDPGTYRIHVGRSVDDISHTFDLEI
ncbi:glycoside hydrolase family 3 C-terminal domain-containing protein [Pseudonocardia sp. NPDC049635]|uniref:beta-glucosidase family protein n=1 Tax=Pseudonocardia sp. NPDC049635 TaxID=3155506 RepID=UPI0033C75FCC